MPYVLYAAIFVTVIIACRCPSSSIVVAAARVVGFDSLSSLHAPIIHHSSMSDQSEDNEWPDWTFEKLRHASYKDLGTPSEVEARFYKHLLSSDSCRKSLTNLLCQKSTTTRDYSITIDSFALTNADPILGHLLLKFPSTLLPLLENAVVQAQRELARQWQEESPIGTEIPPLLVKGCQDGSNATRVHARLVNLPPSCSQSSLAQMEASDVGQIWQITGTCVRTGPVQMYESARTYQCTGKKGCNRSFIVHADLEQRNNALEAPERCPLSNNGERCSGTSLKVVEGGSVHTDYQEIKIQEAASSLGIGHIPRSLLVKLQHDLVDQCQPGDEVVVVGSLIPQWQQPRLVPDMECHVGMALSAHSVVVVAEKGSSAWKDPGASSIGELDKFRKEFEEYWSSSKSTENPIAARDFICRSVCPNLYGLQVVKLALLLTLIGGVSSEAYSDKGGGQHPSQGSLANDEDQENEEPVEFRVSSVEEAKDTHAMDYFSESTTTIQKDPEKEDRAVKTRRRDQSHMLLVGDPGTGKSQFLRFAAALCPRSVLTTGVGTTSAGLTCAAVREGSGKEFALEAGALVLADKGVCCIDEFGCIQEKDRTTIHEAMEQQTLSVAKAGIVCKLNCRATIIAVMNPRDCLYDNQASLSTNTGLGTPLLSRFDLIFKLIDSSDAERDSNVTTYLLNRAIQGAGLDVVGPTAGDQADPWSMEKLRAYIVVIKERYMPELGDEAAQLLERHYEKCRASQSNTIPLTVRFLESMIRLSQAHARLLWRQKVTLEDAAAVIQVLEASAFCYGGFDNVGDDPGSMMYRDPMTVDFSDDPDTDFVCFEYRILSQYGMLDNMTDDNRKKAMALLGQPSMGSSSWQAVESQRQYSTVAPQAASAPSNPWTDYNGNPVASDCPWDQSASVSMTQDHYGRAQYPTQSQPVSKRPRH